MPGILSCVPMNGTALVFSGLLQCSGVNVITPDRLRERTTEIEERAEAVKKANGSFDGLTYWQEKHLKRVVNGIDKALVRYTNCGATQIVFPLVLAEEYAQWLTAYYRNRGFQAESRWYQGGIRTGFVRGWVVHLTW